MANKRRGQVHIRDEAERHEYIGSCLDRMYEGAREIERLKAEYADVTDDLHDLDELQALPPDARARLTGCARKIKECEQIRVQSEGRKNRISDERYSKMERLEGQYLDAIRKFSETEDYHRKIKSDLKRLDSERQAFYMREEDLEHTMSATRDVSVICMVALVAVLIVLFFLQHVLKLQVAYGYMAALLLGAVAIVVMYTRNHNAVKELRSVEASINRLVMLQNTVKIRYVNNRNLLDYYSLKYGVEKSSDLKKMAKRYEAEKKERMLVSDAAKELGKAEQELFALLDACPLRHASKWVHMSDLFLSDEEEAKYRHNLLERRKQLRERMDYNQDTVIGKAKDVIRRVVKKYPRFADEITEQVDRFIREKNIQIDAV